MKRLLSLTALFMLLVVTIAAQKKPSQYTVMFYNVENVFDTIDTPGVRDTEFTPNGVKKWTAHKYNAKMENLQKVFFDQASTDKQYPTVIGVSEIENRSIMEDLANLPKLRPANYQIVHYDSPDARGIDVAFLYNPAHFKLAGSKAFPVKPSEEWRTRDIVLMWGTIEAEPFYFMIGHWPSRFGGQAASAPGREFAAQVCRNLTDSIQAVNPEAKIVIMGDLNDDPKDASVSEVLGAKGKRKEVKEGDLYNPYFELHAEGLGTLMYRGKMNLFDNIIVNENLMNATTGKLKLQKNRKGRYGNIFDRRYLHQQSGQFKGYNLRTYVGNNYQGGFSDHLPVFIHIAK